MPREVELRPRCEDAHPTRVRRIVLRQDEGGFAEIEFASNLLHALGRNAGRVRQNRELITAERCRTENINDVKRVLHEINLPCVASSLDDEVDLNAGPKRQRGHRDRRAGGKGLTEILCVDAIHRDEVTHAREKHAGARNVIETPAGGLENRREIPEDALCLGHDTPLDHLASGRVLADLTAEVEETTDFDRLGKRADRRRKFGRGNCGLAHGRLLWILGWMVRMVEPEVARASNALWARAVPTSLDASMPKELTIPAAPQLDPPWSLAKPECS